MESAFRQRVAEAISAGRERRHDVPHGGLEPGRRLLIGDSKFRNFRALYS
jgi:hypothetical protein